MVWSCELGSSALCCFCHDCFIPCIRWDFSGDGERAHVIVTEIAQLIMEKPLWVT